MSEKAIAGRARKAARAEQKEKEEAAALEVEEEAKWQQGAKGKTVADERREKRDQRLIKKLENCRIAAEDERALLESLEGPPISIKGTPQQYLYSRDLQTLAKPLKDAYCLFNANSLQEAVTSINSSYLLSWQKPCDMKNVSFAIEVETAFKQFSEREDEKVQELYPNLVRRKREEVLWKMFERSRCNPGNKMFEYADISKEEKLNVLLGKKRILERKNFKPWSDLRKSYRSTGEPWQVWCSNFQPIW